MFFLRTVKHCLFDYNINITLYFEQITYYIDFDVF